MRTRSNPSTHGTPFIPMCGLYSPLQLPHIAEGLRILAQRTDTGIIYLRTPNVGVSVLGNLRAQVREVNPNFTLIGGLELHHILGEEAPVDYERAYHPGRWAMIAALVSEITRKTRTRRVCLIHEPMLAPFHTTGQLPNLPQMARAYRRLYAKGYALGFDQPVGVRYGDKNIDAGKFIDVILRARTFYMRTPLCSSVRQPWWLPAYTGTYLPSPDDWRYTEAQAHAHRVGPSQFHHRFFVTRTGQWPGFGTTFNPQQAVIAVSEVAHRVQRTAPPVFYILQEDWVSCAVELRRLVSTAVNLTPSEGYEQ